MSEPLVALSGVGRTFRLRDGSDLPVLAGIDLVVDRGETVAITGRSGTGKSTLLNILGLLDRPTEGSYRFAGHDVGEMAERRRAALRSTAFGFVFQQYNLLPRRSALFNVMTPALLRGGPTPACRRRAADLLDAVGLAERRDATPEQLSGGEQQRVAMARALMNEPDVVLADEPTGSLDVATSEQVMSVLLELPARHDAVLVVVTHDRQVAARCARQVDLGACNQVTATTTAFA